VTDIAVNPPPLMLLESERLDSPPDSGKGLLRVLCEITLCRACIFHGLCSQFEANEASYIYIFTPLQQGA
jgi:hypothetical protein